MIKEAAKVTKIDAAAHDPPLRDTIEQQIVPGLLRLYKPMLTSASFISEADVASVALHAASDDMAQVLAIIDDMLRAGVPATTVCLDLLAPAARHLGERWDRDDVNFADVTIGMCCLQRALRSLVQLGPATGVPKGRQSDAAPRILLVPVPGDQHHFGVAMAAHLFRRAGWAVSTGMSPTLDGLLGIVGRCRFHVVGLSASCDRHMRTLTMAVAGIRNASCNPDVLTIVGGPLAALRPGLAAEIRADADAADFGSTPDKLMILLHSRQERLTARLGVSAQKVGMMSQGVLRSRERRAFSRFADESVVRHRCQHP